MEKIVNDGVQVDIFSLDGRISQPYYDFISYVHEHNMFVPWNDFLNNDIGSHVYNVFCENYWRSVSVDGIIYGLSPHFSRITSAGFIFTNPNIDYDLDAFQYFFTEPSFVVSELQRYLPYGYPLMLNDHIFSIGRFLGYKMISEQIAFTPERGAFHLFEDDMFKRYIETANILFVNNLLAPPPNQQNQQSNQEIIAYATDQFYFDDIVRLEMTPIYYENSLGVTGISRTSQFIDECFFLFYLLLTDRELADALTYGIDAQIDDNGFVVETIPPYPAQASFAIASGFYRNVTPSTVYAWEMYGRELEAFEQRATPRSCLGFRLNRDVNLMKQLQEIDLRYGSFYNSMLNDSPMWCIETLHLVDEIRNIFDLDDIIGEINSQYREWADR
jgi:hypothetical protein